MKIEFPHYDGWPDVDVPQANLTGIFSLPRRPANEGAIEAALAAPIGTPPLRQLAKGKRSALIVCDDVCRPSWPNSPLRACPIAASSS